MAQHSRGRGRGRGRRNFTRFHAAELDEAGYRTFMKYVEANPARAKLVKRAERWEWSSAAVHCVAAHLPGADWGELLSLEAWQLQRLVVGGSG